MPALPRRSWALPGALLLLSLIPLLAGAVRVAGLLEGLSGGAAITPDNARFVASPLPVLLHIVGASLFCVLGAFQFEPALRARAPRWHRPGGRLAALGGGVAALTGVWMTVAYAIPAALQGGLLFGVRLVVGLAMAAALVLAVRAAVQGRIGPHRAWMLRAYALGQGAGTQVLVLLPLTLIAGAPTPAWRDALMSACWALNLAIAEGCIRRRGPATPPATSPSTLPAR